jgi:hypothetical protein
MNPRAYTSCGIDDERPENPFVFVIAAGSHRYFKGPVLAYHPDSELKRDKKLVIIHNRKGVYHEGTLTKEGTIQLGNRREDIKLHNRPSMPMPNNFGPVTIPEGPFVGPWAHHQRVFGKQ